MAPFAAGFQVLIAASAVLGTMVGAIGGAVIWRLRWNVFLGALLTGAAFLLIVVAESPKNFTWLPTRLTWGIPPMMLSYLVASLAGRWLADRFRPAWTTLAAFGIAITVGFLCLLSFRWTPQAPLSVSVGGSACSIVLLLRSRKPLRD